jgi:hypothetical protein
MLLAGPEARRIVMLGLVSSRREGEEHYAGHLEDPAALLVAIRGER